MAYRRRFNGLWTKPEERKVTVSITWDLVTNAAYRLKFDNIGPHFPKIQLVISVIKQTIPSSQYEYDGETKTWYIGERYIRGIVDICNTIPDFDVVYTEKPSELPTSKMYNKDEDYAEFKRMLSFAHVPWEESTNFKIAKRAYLKAAMYLHPDIRPDMATEMTTLNTVWDRLKTSYFKEKEQVSAS